MRNHCDVSFRERVTERMKNIFEIFSSKNLYKSSKLRMSLCIDRFKAMTNASRRNRSSHLSSCTWQDHVLIRGRVATLVSTVGQNNPF
jgi:hypothetical protein